MERAEGVRGGGSTISGGHVLVARLDGPGGAILTGPAVRAIRAGARRLTFLSSPAGAVAAGMLPGVDQVEAFEAPWALQSPRTIRRAELLMLLNRVAGMGVSEALIFTSNGQCALAMAMLLRLVGVDRVSAITDDEAGALLDISVRLSEEMHEVERNLALAEAAGYPLPPGDAGRLAIHPELTDDPRLDLPAGPYVVVHPGASAPARAWSAERNREAVDALTAAGWPVVVTGSAAEQALTSIVSGGGASVTDLGGRTELATLATVLRRAAVVVSGNTTAAHLSAAVGTPVVSLHAPTEPAVRWAPWKVPHVLLGQQDIGCAGCRARVCPLETQACLSGVGAEDVVRAVEQLTTVIDLTEGRVPA